LRGQSLGGSRVLRDRGNWRLRDLGLNPLVRQHLRDRKPADPGHVLRAAEGLQPVHGRLQHVDRVRRAQALREDVADAGELEDGADAAAGDDAGALARRAEQHACGVELPDDLVGDRLAVLRHREEVLLGVVHRLRDRERHLPGLAVAHAYAIDLVAAHHERREREAPAALHDLGDTVDLDHALLELAGLLGEVALDLPFDTAQNWSPPSRAASASAFTRPWKRKPPRSNTTVSTPAFFAAAARLFPPSAAWSVFDPLNDFARALWFAAASVLPPWSSTSCASIPRFDR